MKRFTGASLTRDFRLQVFFINQCPWAPYWGRFEFFWKLADIFANECLSQVSTTPAINLENRAPWRWEAAKERSKLTGKKGNISGLRSRFGLKYFLRPQGHLNRVCEVSKSKEFNTKTKLFKYYITTSDEWRVELLLFSSWTTTKQDMYPIF